MNEKYWLIKEEPTKYSFFDLINDKTTIWDGVRNNLALKNIRKITKNDKVFYYHSGTEKSIIEIVKVIKSPYKDPKHNNEKFVVFNIKPIKKLKNPVELKKIKSLKMFEKFELVRIPRLSVMPVEKKYWDKIIKLSEKEIK